MATRACALLLLLAGASLAALAPPAGAAGDAVRSGTLSWEYVVSVPDPASGVLHVELTLRGFDGLRDERIRDDPYLLRSFTFHKESSKGVATNVTPGPSTPFDASGPTFTLEVDGDAESFSYDVQGRDPAFRDGEWLQYVGPDFALFKSETIALNFQYSYIEGTTFGNRTTVRFLAPPGWSVATPWAPAADGAAFALAPDEVQPAGYVAMGAFRHDETRDLAGRSFRYVRLGDEGEYEPRMWEYLEKATPYYQAAYGPSAGPRVLVVNAPSPMFRGGLGGTDSLFVHEDVQLRTLAHEYAHVWQLFSTVEREPASTIWVNEGDADYRSALSLVAAEIWGPEDVDALFREALRDKENESLADARLPMASYGGRLERFAYHKGMVVLRALDDIIQQGTQGRAGVADVLRILNERHGRASVPHRVENADVQAAVEEVLGVDATGFFDRYVLGTEWPAVGGFTPQAQLVLGPLRLEPTRAVPGHAVVAYVNVTNGGTTPLARTLDLLLDETPVGSQEVRLGVGASAQLSFPFTAPAQPGDHEARLLYQRATLRSLSPANLTLARTSVSPETPVAGEPLTLLVFVRNDGEQAGSAQVDVLDAGQVIGFTTQRPVDALTEAALTIPLHVAEPGPRALEVRVATQGGGVLAANVSVDVRPAERAPAPPLAGGAGVDGAGGPALAPTPVPGAWAALAAGALAAALGRRARTR